MNPLKHIGIVLLVAVLLSSGILLQQQIPKQEAAAGASGASIDVDQILIKVVVKQGEFISRPVRISNRGLNAEHISIQAAGAEGLIKIPEQQFLLQPGQTKILFLRFSPQDEEAGTSFSPGVYVGKLIISGNQPKSIPVVIEVESKDVLFDMNLNPVSAGREVPQGGDFTIEVRLFNLLGLSQANVQMEYQLKDTASNTIITESESVVVKTQASFFKRVHIPDNLARGEYVFSAIATYGSSVGTASALLDVGAASQLSTLKQICVESSWCWLTAFVAAIALFAVAAYIYFFVGLWAYTSINQYRVSSKQAKEDIQKEWLWIWIITLWLFIAVVAVFPYSGVLPLVQIAAAARQAVPLLPLIASVVVLFIIAVWIMRTAIGWLGKLRILKSPEERQRQRFNKYLKAFNQYLSQSEHAISQADIRQVDRLMPSLEAAARSIESLSRQAGKAVIRKKVELVKKHRDILSKSLLRQEIKDQEIKGQGIGERQAAASLDPKRGKVAEFNEWLRKLEHSIQRRDKKAIAASYPKAKKAYAELLEMDFTSKAKAIFYRKMRQAYEEVKQLAK